MNHTQRCSDIRKKLPFFKKETTNKDLKKRIRLVRREEREWAGREEETGGGPILSYSSKALNRNDLSIAAAHGKELHYRRQQAGIHSLKRERERELY